jgi:hypothetical protein
MIAKILKACRNAHDLSLSGNADISQVILKISDHCRQIENLNLFYKGSIVNGPAMRSLLQCCPKLEIFFLYSNLDLLAYESLALYGGSLTSLSLMIPDEEASTNRSTYCHSFPSNSLIFDPSFKPNRKKMMRSFTTNDSLYLHAKSVAAFLSCFGTIKSLEIDVSHSLSPLTVYEEDLYNIRIFHVEKLTLDIYNRVVDETDGRVFDQYDHYFLALMSACRSIKELTLRTDVLHPSSLISLAYMCHHRQQPFSLLAYPQLMRLTPLKHLLPYIRLIAL